MVVSDTAANVKSCRATICAFWPWILNCPDPCHQLNLMIKDIMVWSKKFPKIGAFTEVSAFLALSFCYILLTSCHGKAMKNHFQYYNILFAQQSWDPPSERGDEE